MALLGFVRGPDSHSGISGLFNRPSHRRNFPFRPFSLLVRSDSPEINQYFVESNSTAFRSVARTFCGYQRAKMKTIRFRLNTENVYEVGYEWALTRWLQRQFRWIRCESSRQPRLQTTLRSQHLNVLP